MLSEAVVLVVRALMPTAVLFEAVVLVVRALMPTAVLFTPVVLAFRAPEPTAVLLAPVLLARAPEPRAVLSEAVVLPVSALIPIAVLFAPVVLESSAVSPRTVLDATEPPPRPISIPLITVSEENVLTPAIVSLPVRPTAPSAAIASALVVASPKIFTYKASILFSQALVITDVLATKFVSGI